MSTLGKAMILARNAAMRTTAARQNAALATIRSACSGGGSTSAAAATGTCVVPPAEVKQLSSPHPSTVLSSLMFSGVGGGPTRIPSPVSEDAAAVQATTPRSYSSTSRRSRRRNYTAASLTGDAALADGEDLTSLDGSITMDELTRLASQKSTPLSLANMYRYASVNKPAQRLRNAQFLHRELPVRMAQRAVDLLTLPHGLNNTRQVRSVANIYLKYLEKFRDIPFPTDDTQEYAFTDLLHSLILDRTSIPSAIAAGISTLKDTRREELDVRRLQEMEEALYRFFTARVGLRFLTEHHILSDTRRRTENEDLRLQQSCLDNVPLEHDLDDDFLGCIQKRCDPVKEVRRVADQVSMHCAECYGVAPEIAIVDCTSRRDADVDFTYVPHHLQYMLCELLKNASRASVRRYLNEKIAHEASDNKGTLDKSVAPSAPSIRVVVVKGAEDVTIKIADKAGGLPRSDARKVWSFAHTKLCDSLVETESETEFETDEFTGASIRGFGLPLARIYARYFGGELTLKSMEGYGVDAYLYLPVLGVACENLPERVTQSPGNLDSNPLVGNYGGDRERDEDFWTNEASDSSPTVAIERLTKRAL